MGPENNDTSELAAANDDRTTVDDVNLSFDADADFQEDSSSSSSGCSTSSEVQHFSPTSNSNGTSPFEVSFEVVIAVVLPVPLSTSKNTRPTLGETGKHKLYCLVAAPD